MRARSDFVVATMASLVALSALASSCTSFGDVTPPPADASSDAPSTDTGDVGDAGITDGGEDGSKEPFCVRNPSHRLCDDFQDEILQAAHWDEAPAASGLSSGVVTIAGASAGVADPVLRVDVPVVGQASAFLRHDIGLPNALVEFVLTLHVTGFDADDYVELATIYAVGTNDSAGIAFDKNGLRLIAGEESSVPLLIAPRNKQRLRVVLGPLDVTVFEKDGTQLGKIAFTGLTGRNDLRFGIGLVYTTGCAAGTIEIDDVILDY